MGDSTDTVPTAGERASGDHQQADHSLEPSVHQHTSVDALTQQQALPQTEGLQTEAHGFEAHQASAAHAHEASVEAHGSQVAQGHYGHHQQLLYAQHDPHAHHLAHLASADQHNPAEAQPSHHHPPAHEMPGQEPQALHLQHEAAIQQPHSAGAAMPHPSSFAQQLMDPHLSQQQLAQYHQHIAQFPPQAYQHGYHAGHLGEVPQLYFAQGIPPQHLQAYQEAAGGAQDSMKADMSIDEAAAAHLTALRNTGRPDGQLPDGQQVALGQPPQLGHLHAGMAGHGGVDGGREVYMQPGSQALLGSTAGRAPSKRKAWRASHEGQGTEPLPEPVGDGTRARRKQTRRPDRLCHHDGCFVTPTYNYPNEKKRIFCVTHKLDGMVNVVAKRCAHPDCNVNPRFNYDGHTRGMYCSEHKLDGMVNVIDRRCQEPDCKKFPSHNYPGSHKKLYCASHKKEGMVDMSHGSN